MPTIDDVSRDIKIIVVEDEAVSRTMLTKSLEQLGFGNVYAAETAESVLNKIQNGYGDIVFCDMYLSGKMTGLDLLRSVRASGVGEILPFVMTTREDRKEKVLEILKSGATSYMVKPIRTDRIKQTLIDVFCAPPKED